MLSCSVSLSNILSTLQTSFMCQAKATQVLNPLRGFRCNFFARFTRVSSIVADIIDVCVVHTWAVLVAVSGPFNGK